MYAHICDVYVCIYIYIHIYTYIERERERNAKRLQSGKAAARHAPIAKVRIWRSGGSTTADSCLFEGEFPLDKEKSPTTFPDLGLTVRILTA